MLDRRFTQQPGNFRRSTRDCAWVKRACKRTPSLNCFLAESRLSWATAPGRDCQFAVNADSCHSIYRGLNGGVSRRLVQHPDPLRPSPSTVARWEKGSCGTAKCATRAPKCASLRARRLSSSRAYWALANAAGTSSSSSAAEVQDCRTAPRRSVDAT